MVKVHLVALQKLLIIYLINKCDQKIRHVKNQIITHHYIDKSICLLATLFTYYPIRIIKPFYYL